LRFRFAAELLIRRQLGIGFIWEEREAVKIGIAGPDRQLHVFSFQRPNIGTMAFSAGDHGKIVAHLFEAVG